jgi:hypothetical protein
MIKPLISAALALWTAAATATAATAVTYTQTNVLQNINLQLTIYQQGATNPNGKKVADQVTSYTTKNLIAALGAATGSNFGAGAKLVQSTVYSNATITTGPAVFSTVLSTNLALATNSFLSIGVLKLYGSFYGSDSNNAGTLTISNDTFISGELTGGIATNVLSVVTGGTTNESVTIETNALTTLTPSTDTNGFVTSVAVLTQMQEAPAPTKSILTNVSSEIAILYGGTANTLYPVTNYLSFSTNSAEIVVETGSGLGTTNALTVTNLASQTGFSIQGLTINYFTLTGPTNLILTLQGFVKQALKVDTLAAKHGTNAAVVEDIFGASSTWNVIGSGYAGGTYTTNPTSVPILGGYLTNASPIVVEGSVNVSFLKNLPQ